MKYVLIFVNWMSIVAVLGFSGYCFAAETKVEQPAEYRLPLLETEDELVLFLLEILDYFPKESYTGYSFNYNPLELLEDSQRLVKELLLDSRFIKAIDRKKKSPDISVLRTSNRKNNKSNEIDASVIVAWKFGLQKAIRSDINILESIAFVLGKISGDSSERALNELIKKLPPVERAVVYKQSGAEEKIYYLQHHLSSDIKIKAFEAQIQRIIEVVELEDQLELLVEIAILGQNKNVARFSADMDPSVAISNLSQSHFKQMVDYEAYLLPRFQTLNRALKGLENELAVKIKVLKAIHTKKRKVWQEETSQEKKTKGIHLSSGNFIYKVYRAFAGQDCSSSHSFAAVANPDEILYFIKNSDDKLIGYIEGTLVQANKTSVLYVSSINGPKISDKYVRYILNGLYYARTSLGFEHIALPRLSMLKDLVNYKIIRNQLKYYIANGSPVKLKYKHKKLRHKIENFSSNHNTAIYDSMSSNKKAILIDSSMFDQELDYSVSESKEYTLFNNSFKITELAYNRIFSLGLSMMISSREGADRIFLYLYKSNRAAFIKAIELNSNYLVTKSVAIGFQLREPLNSPDSKLLSFIFLAGYYKMEIASHVFFDPQHSSESGVSIATGRGVVFDRISAFEPFLSRAPGTNSAVHNMNYVFKLLKWGDHLDILEQWVDRGGSEEFIISSVLNQSLPIAAITIVEKLKSQKKWNAQISAYLLGQTYLEDKYVDYYKEFLTSGDYATARWAIKSLNDRDWRTDQYNRLLKYTVANAPMEKNIIDLIAIYFRGNDYLGELCGLQKGERATAEDIVKTNMRLNSDNACPPALSITFSPQ